MATSAKSVLLVIIFMSMLVTSMCVGWNINGNVALTSAQEHLSTVKDKIAFARSLLTASKITGAAIGEEINLATAEIIDEAENAINEAETALAEGDTAASEETIANAEEKINAALETLLATNELVEESAQIIATDTNETEGETNETDEENETIELDTIAPTISDVSYTANLNYSDSQHISFSVSDNIKVANVILQLDNTNHSLTIAQTYYYSYAPSAGNHTFFIHAIDNSSNSASANYSFIVAAENTQEPTQENVYVNTTIQGSTITKSLLYDSTIIDSTIANSTIRNSYIKNMIVQNALVENWTLRRGIVTYNNVNYSNATNFYQFFVTPIATINYTSIITQVEKGERQYYSNLSIGTYAIPISYSNSSINNINLELTNNVSNVNISIDILSEFKPYSFGVAPYQFVCINVTNISNTIMDAVLKFKIPNTWLSNSNINKSTIKTYKYTFADNSWTVLSAIETSSNSDYTYFSTTTDGFSVFALTGDKNKLCGNGLCDTNETITNCPADCEEEVVIIASVCGNGECETNETITNCPADCTPEKTTICGNNACETGETSETCPQDCVALTGGATFICGDGVCNNGETTESCAVDCAVKATAVCGNNICENSEDKTNCAKDCKKTLSINNVWATLIILFVIIGIAMYTSTFAKKTQEKRLHKAYLFAANALQRGTSIAMIKSSLIKGGINLKTAENIIFEKLTQVKYTRDLNNYVNYHHAKGRTHEEILRQLTNVGWEKELVVLILKKINSQKKK